MKLTFEQFLKEYPIDSFRSEYHILYFLCIMPSGLLSSDVDKISSMAGFKVDWLAFLDQITKEEVSGAKKVEEISQL